MKEILEQYGTDSATQMQHKLLKNATQIIEISEEENMVKCSNIAALKRLMNQVLKFWMKQKQRSNITPWIAQKILTKICSETAQHCKVTE